MKLVIVTGGRSGHCAAAVRALIDEGYFVSTCSRAKTESIADLERDPARGRHFFYTPSKWSRSSVMGGS
jgi:NAD(P)-dependent dehydrogenase (short-subunit alcohol dehydrogenase family)